MQVRGWVVCGLVAFAIGCAAPDSDRDVPQAADSVGSPTHSAGTLLWSFDAGSELWSPPAFVDGVLYFGTDGGEVIALDVATREPRWTVPTGGRIRSTTVVHGGSVLVASDDGQLYALDRRDGNERWRFDLGGDDLTRRLPATDAPYDYDYLHSSPTVADGVVYIGTRAGDLIAVDLMDGGERWRFSTGERIRSTPAVMEGRVYFGSWDGNVYALDAGSGTEGWRSATGGIVQGSPAVARGRVFVGSRSAQLFALDAADGSLEWRHVFQDGSWVESSPIIHGDALLVGTSDALALLSFDPDSGALNWSFRTGGWSWGTPVVSGSTAYIGAISAAPYYFEGVVLERGFFAVDVRSGEEQWRIAAPELDGYVTGGVFAVAVAESVVYVLGLDGVVRAVAR